VLMCVCKCGVDVCNNVSSDGRRRWRAKDERFLNKRLTSIHPLIKTSVWGSCLWCCVSLRRISRLLVAVWCNQTITYSHPDRSMEDRNTGSFAIITHRIIHIITHVITHIITHVITQAVLLKGGAVEQSGLEEKKSFIHVSKQLPMSTRTRTRAHTHTHTRTHRKAHTQNATPCRPSWVAPCCCNGTIEPGLQTTICPSSTACCRFTPCICNDIATPHVFVYMCAYVCVVRAYVCVCVCVCVSVCSALDCCALLQCHAIVICNAANMTASCALSLQLTIFLKTNLYFS